MLFPPTEATRLSFAIYHRDPAVPLVIRSIARHIQARFALKVYRQQKLPPPFRSAYLRPAGSQPLNVQW